MKELSTGSQERTFDAVLVRLLDFMHRYTWCIAAPTTGTLHDVALFDHARTAAAIAACLYRDSARTGREDLTYEYDAVKERFCLLVADLSGIQNYIFQITESGDPEGKGTARRLRARSLFIQLIADVIADRILRRFDLPVTNMLMASGGRLYILLPNLPDTGAWLLEETLRIDKSLYDHPDGEVVANTAWVTFDDSGFSEHSDTGWSNVLRHANEGLALAKARRLRRVLVAAVGADSVWDENSMVLREFRGPSACNSCGHRPQAAGGDDGLCRWCRSDLNWGRILPHALWVAYYDRPGVPESRSTRVPKHQRDT
jgi:CRISPR-associated protein Csm1